VKSIGTQLNGKELTMATFQVFKETALPGSLQPNSIYFIAPASPAGRLDVYVSNSAGNAVRRTISQAEIQALIDSAVAGASGGTIIVDDIAARNLLTPEDAQEVLVIDASADSTVTAGAAKYVWRASNTTWIKTAEVESMDLVLNWSALVGRPTSTPGQIDTAVTNSHTHANKTQLDLVSEDGDTHLTYRGTALVRTGAINW